MKYFSLAVLSFSTVLATGCSSLSLINPEKPATVAAIQAPILPQPPIPPAPEVEPTPPYYQPNIKVFGQPTNKSFETQYSEYKATVRLMRKKHYEAQLAAYNIAIQNAIEAARQNPKIAAGGVVTVPPVADIQLPEAPQVLIPRTVVANTDQINVADLDLDLLYLEGKARHYAPVFANKPERKQAEVKAKNLAKQLNTYAADPQASYEVLLRAMKANVIARNMDVGTNAAEKSIEYFGRLFKLKPKDPETSYWYGFSLAEGGGFQESITHLNVAIKANYQEAYLALANTYLLQGKKKNAIDTLTTYKTKFASDAKYADQLIAQIKSGARYAIWQYIPDPATIATGNTTQKPSI